MESAAASVCAGTCPGSKQDGLISSRRSCSCIFRQGMDVSALSCRHIPKSLREGAGIKGTYGKQRALCESFPKPRGAAVGLAGSLQGWGPSEEGCLGVGEEVNV